MTWTGNGSRLPLVAGKALEWIGTGAVIILTGIRCLVRLSNEVPWELRELSSSAVVASIGAKGTILLDCMGVIVLNVVLLGSLLQKKRALLYPLFLWLIGCFFVLWHGLHGADAMRIGVGWLGAIALGLATFYLAGCCQLKRWIVLGFVALLLPVCCKAFFQVGFEHPLTVKYYREHKNEILARYGWQDGDSEARRFEGRLLRNDAKGVFTISNVFATVLIGLTGVGIGVFGGYLSAWRSGGQLWPVPASGALVAMGVVSLFLTQSRGGIGAMVLGAVAALVPMLWRKRKWGKQYVARLICLAPIGVLPIMIWASGAMSKEGRLVPDPSLAVRGWHLESAWLIWTKAPLAGVGPGRFQEAYMLHKNPMSPENVTDPHNILANWIATLGLGGVAWVLLLLYMVWNATGLIELTKNRGESWRLGENGSAGLMFLLGVMGSLFLIQYVLQVKDFGPEATLAWLFGTSGAILAVTFLGKREFWGELIVRYGILAGIISVTIHVQMDMSMSDPMAAPLLISIVGFGAGLAKKTVTEKNESDRHIPSESGYENHTYSRVIAVFGWGACGLIGLMAGFVIIGFVFPFCRTMTGLKTAAKEVTAENFRLAIDQLGRSVRLLPRDPRPSYLMGLTRLHQANYLQKAGKVEAAIDFYRSTIENWDKAEEPGFRRAFLCRRKADVALQLFELGGGKQWRIAAINYAKKAVSLDPYNRYGCIRMAEVGYRLGFCEEAKNWYERALRVDELMKVLPDLKFSAKERERAELRLLEIRRNCRS